MVATTSAGRLLLAEARFDWHHPGLPRPTVAVLLALLLSSGCSGGATAPEEGPLPGPDTPKGLWLRLVDNGAPEVTAVDGVTGFVCVGMSN